MSERYTSYSPDYQKDAAAALDRLLSFLLDACQLRASDPETWGTAYESRRSKPGAGFQLKQNEIEAGSVAGQPGE